MKEIKIKKPKKNFLLRFSLLCFAAFTIYTLINQQIQISRKEETLHSLNHEITLQEIKNNELKEAFEDEDSYKQYAEKSARKDYNYAQPNEKVIINIGGTE